MAINTGEKPINIKNLVVEKPKETVRPFDAETEITKEDWEVIDGFINKFKHVNSTSASLLTDIKLLSPERFATYKLLEPDWTQVVGQVPTMKTSIATSYAALFDKVPEKLGLDDDFYKKLVEDVKARNEIFGVMQVARLVPERLNELATDERQDYNLKKLKFYRDSSDYRDWAWWGGMFRILYPRQNLGINNKDWEGMRKQLRGQMDRALEQKAKFEDDWSPAEFVSEAMHMKILAADEVKVDKDGIHLIFNPQTGSSEEAPPLPESKKY